MAIQSIEDAKTMRAYMRKLGREGIAKRIEELGALIVEGEGAYQSTIKYAGMIHALALGCREDSYWSEKAHIGFRTMVEEARRATF